MKKIFAYLICCTSSISSGNQTDIQKTISRKNFNRYFISYNTSSGENYSIYYFDNEYFFEYKKNNFQLRIAKNSYSVIKETKDKVYRLIQKKNSDIILIEENNPVYFCENSKKECSPQSSMMKNIEDYKSVTLRKSALKYSTNCLNFKSFKKNFVATTNKMLKKIEQSCNSNLFDGLNIKNGKNILIAEKSLTDITVGNTKVPEIACELSQDCQSIGSFKLNEKKITLYPNCVTDSKSENCELESALFEELLHFSMGVGNEPDDHRDIKKIARRIGCTELPGLKSFALEGPSDNHTDFSKNVVAKLQPSELPTRPEIPNDLSALAVQNPGLEDTRSVSAPLAPGQLSHIQSSFQANIDWGEKAISKAIMLASKINTANASQITSPRKPGAASPMRSLASEKNEKPVINIDKTTASSKNLASAASLENQAKDEISVSKTSPSEAATSGVKQNAITSEISNNPRPSSPRSEPQREASANLVSAKPINASNINPDLPNEIVEVIKNKIPNIKTINDFTARLNDVNQREEISKVLAEKQISIYFGPESKTIGVQDTKFARYVFAIMGSGSQTRLRRIDRNNR